MLQQRTSMLRLVLPLAHGSLSDGAGMHEQLLLVPFSGPTVVHCISRMAGRRPPACVWAKPLPHTHLGTRGWQAQGRDCSFAAWFVLWPCCALWQGGCAGCCWRTGAALLGWWHHGTDKWQEELTVPRGAPGAALGPGKKRILCGVCPRVREASCHCSRKQLQDDLWTQPRKSVEEPVNASTAAAAFPVQANEPRTLPPRLGLAGEWRVWRGVTPSQEEEEPRGRRNSIYTYTERNSTHPWRRTWLPVPPAAQQ